MSRALLLVWSFLLLLPWLFSAYPALAIDWDTADLDGDGYTEDEGDCNDGDPEINPGVREVCDDEIDNDCDLTVDFNDPECTVCGGCGTGRAERAGAGAVLGVVALLTLWRRARGFVVGVD